MLWRAHCKAWQGFMEIIKKWLNIALESLKKNEVLDNQIKQ